MAWAVLLVDPHATSDFPISLGSSAWSWHDSGGKGCEFKTQVVQNDYLILYLLSHCGVWNGDIIFVPKSSADGPSIISHLTPPLLSSSNLPSSDSLLHGTHKSGFPFVTCLMCMQLFIVRNYADMPRFALRKEGLTWIWVQIHCWADAVNSKQLCQLYRWCKESA